MYIKLKLIPEVWETLESMVNRTEHDYRDRGNDKKVEKWSQIMKDIKERNLTVKDIEDILKRLIYYIS